MGGAEGAVPAAAVTGAGGDDADANDNFAIVLCLLTNGCMAYSSSTLTRLWAIFDNSWRLQRHCLTSISLQVQVAAEVAAAAAFSRSTRTGGQAEGSPASVAVAVASGSASALASTGGGRAHAVSRLDSRLYTVGDAVRCFASVRGALLWETIHSAEHIEVEAISHRSVVASQEHVRRFFTAGVRSASGLDGTKLITEVARWDTSQERVGQPTARVRVEGAPLQLRVAGGHCFVASRIGVSALHADDLSPAWQVDCSFPSDLVTMHVAVGPAATRKCCGGRASGTTAIMHADSEHSAALVPQKQQLERAHAHAADEPALQVSTLYMADRYGHVSTLDVAQLHSFSQTRVQRDWGTESSFFNVIQAKYGPLVDFWLWVALLLSEFLQMLSFSFSQAAPPSLSAVRDVVAELQTLGIAFNSSAVVIVGAVVVALFALVFAVQERVEQRVFLHPGQKRWGYAWLVCVFYTKLASTTGVVPLVRAQVDAIDCTLAEDGTLTWDLAPDTQCFSAAHAPYVIVASVAALVYLPLAYRFIRVNGKLDAIEVTANVFDMSRDMTRDTVSRKVHALSLKSLTYFKSVLALKVIMTAVTTLMTSRPVTIAAFLVAVGAAICGIGVEHPPFFSPAANAVRQSLDRGILWTYLVGMVATIVYSDAAAAAEGDGSGSGVGGAEAGTALDTVLTVLPLLVVPIVVVPLTCDKRARGMWVGCGCGRCCRRERRGGPAAATP